MRKLIIIALLPLIFSCESDNKHSMALSSSLMVLNYDTALQITNKGYFYHGEPFTGFMIEQEKNGRIVYKLPIIEGRENGLALGWYNTGEKLLERYFKQGKIEGTFKQWWPNGNYRYLFNYKNGLLNGPQTVFFPNSKIRQKSNYQLGKEAGLQQTWDTSGQLVSNYTIKDNKLYGVISVKSCIPSTTH